ncbi:MAG: hypothetical protein WCK03_01030, partial [Candidatus Taylorbacteria bacterium]
RKVAVAQQKAFNQPAIHCKIVGEEIPHAHIWVYPDPKNTEGDKKDFIVNADKLKKYSINNHIVFINK